VFIDELHTLVGAGSAEGSLDAANILKPALSRGEIRCIGATTRRVSQVHREGSIAQRRFQAIKVGPPGERETIGSCSRSRIATRFPSRQYTREAIEAAVYQSNRYHGRNPRTRRSIVDEAGARAKLREAGYSEVRRINKSIRVAVEAMEARSHQKDFEKAQFYRRQVTARENRNLCGSSSTCPPAGHRRQGRDRRSCRVTGVPMSINRDGATSCCGWRRSSTSA
jgi:ATP-dependent Clp protease ATP-binding subunit ClpC